MCFSLFHSITLGCGEQRFHQTEERADCQLAINYITEVCRLYFYRLTQRLLKIQIPKHPTLF